MKSAYCIALIVFAIFIQINEGLDCYHCFKVNFYNDNYKNSAIRPVHEKDNHLTVCEENLALSNVITCETGQEHCIFVKMEDPSFTEYVRTCSGGKYACNDKIPDVNVTDCYTCGSDRCNEASSSTQKLLRISNLK